MIWRVFLILIFLSLNIVSLAEDEINPGPTRADTLLRQGIEHHNTKIMALALQKGAKINAVFGMFGNKPAIWQAFDEWQKNRPGSKDVFMFLLSHGADPNIAGFAGERLIQKCIEENFDNPEMLDVLLKAKADVNLVDDEGNSSLHYAVKQYDPAVVDLILKNGARINVKNKKGHAEADWAVMNFNSHHVPRLVEAGAQFANHDVDLFNYRNWPKNDIRFGELKFAAPKLIAEATKSSQFQANAQTHLSAVSHSNFIMAGELTKARAILFGEPQNIRLTFFGEKNKVFEKDLKPVKFRRLGSKLLAFLEFKAPKDTFRVRVDAETLDKKPVSYTYPIAYTPVVLAKEKR